MNSRRRSKIILSVVSALSLAAFFTFLPPEESAPWQKSEISAVKPPIPEASPAEIAVNEPENSGLHYSVPEVFPSGEIGGDNTPLSVADADAEPAAAAEKKAAEPVFLQWQYLPVSKSYIHSHEDKVKGIAIGYYLPQQEISGVSLALAHAYNYRKSGFSMSLLDFCQLAEGVAIFAVGGAVKNSGFSMGLWNQTESNQGVQLGLFNQEKKDSIMDYEFKPDRDESKFGVQAGLINYSDAKGVQFGLWNTNPNSRIKHFPFFNICL